LETRLTHLFALQQVDSQLQEIYELKGDLPRVVAELQSTFEGSSKRLKELTELVTQLKIDRDNTDVELISCSEKIEKYKEQQLQVKSNKQYDALSREIDGMETLIEQSKKNLETYEGKIQVSQQDIESLKKEIETTTAELTEKKAELAEVNKEHEIEETRLVHEREKIVTRIKKEDFYKYERIKNAKNGTAVVAIKRNACGGCFNRVPPQKILELRNNNYIYMCEHCGRIIVSDDVVEKSSILQ
jgi:predicted  nucleic acid-binding Zn-ribbon protein